jgi:hypothetical protein
LRSPDSRRRELIAEALAGRRAEVGPVTPAERPALPPATDPEEALRVVMVRLVPAVTDLPSAAALAEGLEPLAEAARGGDLRFLDAWNNAYEALAAHPELAETPPATRLLALYADILEHHLGRLAH